MRIYPAIDMKAGRAVRLFKGLETEVTDYGEPLEAAKRWISAGAGYLHLVDLDGAFAGEGRNLESVKAIAALGLPVQLGGGIRSMEEIRARFSLGVARVILGTAALEDPALVRQACAQFPDRIVCGIDVKDGKAASRGWVRASEVSALELALSMKAAGVKTVVFTDISKDSTLQGPNLAATAALVRDSGLEVIGSGGVGRLDDLIALREAGCEGAIVGKALYEGRFTLEEALRAAEGEQG
ncbi:MAG: 1-(5-phosphoribosyl)-5-[(5-phosphoribosylamino)methylideneamino]imidazole-4-carboxamide isomerase [Christensenellaceae bacterium]|jgi:phosphoribosylformimino-5-aminoimidazole carboxamide ribotide isomerase|nr:1-(5-phosphoribosyl)-5-[(5-phosphoribosylamino)methylideneamino]imidazole-4-carboxamide isomerase [Christensenellaceae bacterium]